MAPVWLAGISLGDWRAALAKAHTEAVAASCCYHPSSARAAQSAQVIGTGGFRHLAAARGEAATREHRLLQWLKAIAPATRMAGHLSGYGSDDLLLLLSAACGNPAGGRVVTEAATRLGT